MKLGGWLLLILLGFGIYSALSNSAPKTSSGTVMQASTAPVIQSPTFAEQLKDALPLAKAFDPSEFTKDVRSISLAIALLQSWSELVDSSAGMTMSAEGKADLDTLKSVLRQKQVSGYPALRDAYGPALRQVLWEADGKARTISNGFRTIELVSAAFAANRNIKSIHEDMYDTFMQLRFTRAQYKWVDADVEYTYYKLQPPQDGDIVIWSGNGAFRVVN